MKPALIVTIAFAGASSLAGCGRLEGEIKVPIAKQCAASGLKGCPELTEGMVAYAEGEKESGEKKLHAAAAENTPQQLHAFAIALRPFVKSTPDHTSDAMQAAVEVLTRPTPRHGEHHAEAKAEAKPVTAPLEHVSLAEAAPRTKSAHDGLDELRAGAERPAAAEHASACGGIFGSDPKCTMTKVMTGPLVVTNAYTSGGCPDELFLAAGHLDKPHWLLLRVARAPMNVSGQFILEEGEELYAGVRATDKAAKDDPKCTITWSGFRPAGGSHAAPAAVAGRTEEE